MKQILALLLLTLSLSCSNSDKKSASTRSDLFIQFLKKFKPVEFPYVFKFTDKIEVKYDNLQKLNSHSNDTLFVKDEYIDEVYCFGYLKDTSKFYSLIYLFPADNYYPVLITYSKKGEIISKESLIAVGCNYDCGLQSFSENSIINRDYSIYCADTVVWEYFCDSIGNPISNTTETWIRYKRGKINKNGKIIMSKTNEIKRKNNP